MASIVITDHVLKSAIKDKFENTTHIELSFRHDGFGLCNYIRRDEARERIEVIFTKAELDDWSNKDQIYIEAIGITHKLSINII